MRVPITMTSRISQASARTRVLVLVATVVIAVGAIWTAIVWRSEPPVTVVIDTTEEVWALLDRRAAEPWPERPAAHQRPGPAPLLREPLDMATARLFFPRPRRSGDLHLTELFYDSLANIEGRRRHLDYPGGKFVVRTNNLGMREDDDVLAAKPGTRVLILGDSQTAGMVPNHESFANVLEASLGEQSSQVIEILNAGAGGSNPYSYLGMLEHFEELQSDLTLVVVFGGNDFSPMMPLQRYFHRRPAPKFEPISLQVMRRTIADLASAMPHELGQAAYFMNNPDDIGICIDTLAAITLEAEQVCRRTGTHLAFAYIPGAFTTQARFIEQPLQEALDAVGLLSSALDVSHRIADAWLGFLAERKIPCLDLRDLFRHADEFLFWRSDLHLTVTGNQLIAETLQPFVTELLDELAAAVPATSR
jgi:lysophospholipase L1-like esterase